MGRENKGKRHALICMGFKVEKRKYRSVTVWGKWEGRRLSG